MESWFTASGEVSLPRPAAPKLRTATGPIVAILAGAGWFLLVFSEFLPSPERMAWFAQLFLALVLITWLLFRYRPAVAAHFLVASLVLTVMLARFWLQLPGALALLALPAAVAAALIDPRHATLTAAGETAMVVALALFAPATEGPVEATIALLALWGLIGLVYAIWLPAYQFEGWLDDFYRQTQSSLEETRAHRGETKQALADLAQANRQLALANERMTALRLLAEEAQKSKAAFVAKVSHEFRTPLNMIIGLVSLLAGNPQVYGRELPAELLEDLAIVRRNCDHLASLVNDVLALSQAEAGRLVLRREPVDLAAVIDEALAVSRTLLDKKHLTAQVDVPNVLPAAYCDRTRIRQVLLNLVSNAARFTEQGGITVRAALEAGSVVLSVTDTGPGIPPDDAERIFEPFGQAASGIWRERGGSGLGLSISKQFVELHEGRMWLESRLGQGSTFYFTLPVAQPVAPETGPMRWLAEEWTWRERTTRAALPNLPAKPRVILCDPAGEILPALLHRTDEVEFVDTRGLAQVHDELQRCPAHAVLLNGETLQNLWTHAEQVRQRHPDTLVVACSLPSQMARTRAAGAANYMVKPVAQADLMGAIQALGRPVKHVLIVDDDPDVRQLLARMLATQPGLETTTASNGAQALAELRASRPDLLLLDIMMPDMDGWEVLRRKQEDPEIRDIPAILVSSQDPLEQPMSSQALLLTVGEGFSLGRLLNGALAISSLLVKPE